ncbi:multi-sensor signal transduction histidine kinase [Allomuricauda ruestringensis DSM 13258]|uniref:histidine kinase n=1 Tax=Allomuricauda ruestringensis (strain DSM 13258 / CIP 107369 / LMG 19739 / B1) TaxID=886377 RepID=G2PIR2_ALLRU|nr:PAS domain S-box protein [Allomuricauda ruestringensis]AEM71807.1 multi-sensor signal transduction histidine kinase [Allomuricauda ruestringensis DSM 13258]
MKDYSPLFHDNPNPIWVHEIDSKIILEVNEAALDLYGYSRKEFLSLSFQDLLSDVGDLGLSTLFNELDTKKTAWPQKTIVFGKMGNPIKCKFSFQKVFFQDRDCIMVIATNVEHAEEMNSEQSLTDYLRVRASQIAKLGYWKLDIDTGTLIWSDEVYHIWGEERDKFNVNFDSFYNSIHPDDRLLFDQEQGSALEGLQELDFVHRIIRSDGKIKWVHEKGRLIKNSKGKPLSFEGTAQDITAQIEEEQRLKLLESVVTHTNDAVMITDSGPLEEEGPKIVYVNRAFTQMTGYTPEEIIGRTPDMLRGPKTDRNELERFYKTLTKGEPCEVIITNYRKNGSPFWINIAASPVKDAQGRVSHYIAIQRDVSSKINAQLERDFLAKISTTFKENENLGSCLDQVCKLVTLHGGFTFCEVWLPSTHKNSLRFAAMYGKDEAGETFYEHSKNTREMGFGDGLPGTVWETGQSVLWGNIDRNSLFIRKKAAQRSGIKSVLGIPLKHRGTIVGVLAVGTLEREKQFKAHYPVLSKLEDYLGSEINRKRLEEDLTYLFETLPDLICLFDFNGNFLKINKAGCDILGYSEAEIVGSPAHRFIHVEDREISDGLIQKIRDGQETFEIENRYITKTGKPVWLSWHCKVVLDEGVVYATAKDITESKKLQELVSDAFRLARIGGWEIDMIHEKLTWSEGVHQIYETDPLNYEPELEGAINFYREDHREMVKDAVSSAMEKGEAFEYEAAFISAKGNEKWVRAMGQAEIANGKCIRLYGSFQDITQLKEAEHRLLAITNDLPGVTFQYYLYPDGTDKMQSVSQKSQAIWNLTPDECEKHSQLIWDQIKKGGDYEALVQEIQNSVETLQQWHSRWRYIMPNGKIRWHEGYGTPYKLADGTVLFNSMVFDITDEIKLKNLLEETSELSKIGSWEMELLSEPRSDTMYWSPMVRKIIEVDGDYDASLSGGLEFYTPESRPIVEKRIEELIEKGTEYDQEVLLKTGSGKEKWVRIIGKSERANGVCTKIYGSIQDIHAMKTTQLQLQEILGSISDAFYAVDKDWNFTYFNKEAENLLGKKSDEVLGKNLWELFSPVLGTELETVYRRVDKKGRAESFEYLYPGNGSWYEINTYPSNGGVSVYFKNIDERKKASEALESAFREKNMILESIGDAFFAMKEDYTVTYWNKTAERLLGVKREDLIGKNLWDMFPDAVDLPSYTNYNKVLKTREPISFEDYYGIWLEVNAYPSEEGISVFFRDITQKKKANEKILHKTEQLDIIAEMNTELLNYDDWFKVVEKAFGKVGKCIKADRIYYFQNSLNEKTGELETSQRLEWNNEGVPSQINNPMLQNLSFSMVQDFMQPLAQNKAFKAIVSEMPDTETKRLLLEQDIKSILVFPLWVNKKFWGFIGFDDCKSERNWNQDDTSFLRTITTNLSTAIETSMTNQELERSYNEKDQILESIGDAFFAVGRDWTVTYWNKQAEQVLGRKRNEIVGKKLWDEYADAVELEFYAQYHKAMATGKMVTFEEFYPTLNIWFEVSAYPGNEGLSVYFKDITLRKETDIEILRANERFEKVAQATTDAIWDWDIENKIFHRSDGFEKLFGHRVKKRLDESEVWEDSFHADDLSEIKSSLKESLQDPSKEFWKKEYRIVHENGEIKTVVDKGAIIRNGSGQAIRMVGAITDISERIEHERELEELNEALKKNIKDLEITNDQLEQFAFIASHDLQEPLRMITSFLNQLQRKYSGQLDEKADQYIHFATDGAKRMKQIILDLLEYSRAGRSEESPETIDLNELVEEYEVLRSRLIKEKSVKIVKGKFPKVTCYKAPLTQTFHCLMDNAIKYSREGVPPQIKITVSNKKDHWQVKIKDNGIGIDPSFYDKVFIIFQRLHDRDTYGGTGMGLAISKKNVESWGGKIWLESRPGKGSAFYFTINKNKS